MQIIMVRGQLDQLYKLIQVCCKLFELTENNFLGDEQSCRPLCHESFHKKQLVV